MTQALRYDDRNERTDRATQLWGERAPSARDGAMILDRIVVVGAGHTADVLVPRLSRIAPLLVLDPAPHALEKIAEEHGAGARDEDAQRLTFHGVTKLLADGASRFVLEDARGEPSQTVALVAATGADRRNLEICRLAREMGYRPIIGIVIDPRTVPDYEALDAQPIVRAELLGQVVESALRHDGLTVAGLVGQGKGDIVEFVVLPGSPAIDVPLAELRADNFRVAAIYRRGELVLPTGKTTILAEDRVLLVGNPATLRGVAEQLRIGMPMFPLAHGKNVVVYLPGGRDRSIEMEAEVVAIKTRAVTLIRVYPEAAPEKTAVEDTAGDSAALLPHQREKTFEDVPLEGQSREQQLEHLRRLRPGVVVARAEPRSLVDKVLGRGGPQAEICNALRAPVLFPGGAPRYTRVVHAVVQGIANMPLADAAIDLARMLSIPLLLARVTLPAYFGAADPETPQLIARIVKRASLYGLRTETVDLEGNPVRELLRLAKPSDLFVIGRRRTSRDSFTSPDIALRVARAAGCSVLVRTFEEP